MAKSPEKSDGAFRTIREVADWLGVPTHVLRFWESKFEQIAPVKGAGGRRYYRPEDMRLLGGIKVMLHDQGLTIRAVSQKIEDEGVAPVMDLSPELDMPEVTPQRTRRVIRHGEDGSKARVVPFDGAKGTDTAPSKPKATGMPATDASAPPAEAPAKPSSEATPATPEIAPEAPTPPADLLPDQPDAPSEATLDAAPGPDAPPAEAPAPAPEDTASPPDLIEDLPEAPEDTPEAPAPETVPDAPEAVAEPVEDAADETAAAVPEDAATADTAVAEPDAVAPAPAPRHPGAAALQAARESGRIAPENRMKLRRIIRRYRALTEEIAEDLRDSGTG